MAFWFCLGGVLQGRLLLFPYLQKYFHHNGPLFCILSGTPTDDPGLFGEDSFIYKWRKGST